MLLRLALVFNRGRSIEEATPVKLEAKSKEIKLLLPADWLAEHPLTEADLLQEVAYLQEIGLNLTIQEGL